MKSKTSFFHFSNRRALVPASEEVISFSLRQMVRLIVRKPVQERCLPRTKCRSMLDTSDGVRTGHNLTERKVSFYSSLFCQAKPELANRS